MATVLEARDFPADRLARDLDIGADIVLDQVAGTGGRKARRRADRHRRFVRSGDFRDYTVRATPEKGADTVLWLATAPRPQQSAESCSPSAKRSGRQVRVRTPMRASGSGRKARNSRIAAGRGSRHRRLDLGVPRSCRYRWPRHGHVGLRSESSRPPGAQPALTVVPAGLNPALWRVFRVKMVPSVVVALGSLSSPDGLVRTEHVDRHKCGPARSVCLGVARPYPPGRLV